MVKKNEKQTEFRFEDEKKENICKFDLMNSM